MAGGALAVLLDLDMAEIGEVVDDLLPLNSLGRCGGEAGRRSAGRRGAGIRGQVLCTFPRLVLRHEPVLNVSSNKL